MLRSTRRRTHSWWRAAPLVIAAAVALVIAACGSTSGSDGTNPTTTTPGEKSDGTDKVVKAALARTTPSAADAKAAAPLVDQVTAKLFAPLAAAAKDSNIVFSPTSLAVALAMLRQGATGDSARQLDAFLGSHDATSLAQAMNGLDHRLSVLSGPQVNSDGNRGDVALWSANALWGQQGLPWQPPFLDSLARNFGAGLRTVDYEHDADGARQAINRWVSDQTRGKIADLIPSGALTPASRLTLVNALYFKAPWFSALTRTSRPGAFTRLDGTQVSVPQMFTGSALARASGDGWKAVQLEYAGEGTAMTVIVPDAGKFDAVRTQIGTGLLPRVLGAVEQSGEVTLTMPTFTIRTKAVLSDALQAVGVRAPFETVHDFDSISPNAELQVGAVRQQAFIAVDEKGTEAAAATSVEMRAGSANAEPFVLNVDRPFLFVVHDLATGTPLFVGQVLDPTAA